MNKLVDVLIIAGGIGWVLAIVTRLLSRDLIFPALQLPAQTYLDFGWTCFFLAGVLTLRQLRDK